MSIAAVPAGFWILDPQGKKLGRIVHGYPATNNIAFGGDDWKTLYFTSRTHLDSVNVKIVGAAGAGFEDSDARLADTDRRRAECANMDADFCFYH